MWVFARPPISPYAHPYTPGTYNNQVQTLRERIHRIEDEIASACRAANRTRSEVSLIAVSKTHPVELLLEAAEAGLQVFGENRVQEFAEKSEILSSAGFQIQQQIASPQTRVLDIHLIGHLQSNKTAKAAELFSAIDTIDSLRIAQRLNEAAAKLDRIIPILLEIKISTEPSKEGLAPNSPELAHLLEHLPDCKHLHLRGLMTIAPIADDPAVARACFRQLRTLRDTLAPQNPRLSFDALSMGMSGDFHSAIQEGSTEIRIGTAIFGARPRPA